MASWMQQMYAQSVAAKQSVIGVLCASMAGMQPARSHMVVHASDITKPDFCPRQWALLETIKKEPAASYIGTALRATFDVGSATADLVREHWLGDAAHGYWECRCCKTASPFGRKPKTSCKHGGSCDYRYIEPNFRSIKNGVSGSIDVITDLGAPKLFITELKIIATDDFDKLAAPLAEHRVRTNLYLRLAAESDSPLRDRLNLELAKVLYVSRGYGKKHLDHNGQILPFKEFDVFRNDADTEPYVKKADSIFHFRQNGIFPPILCATSIDKRAKGCNVCTECFSGAYPAGKAVW